MRSKTDLPLQKIARFIRQDHATVMHGAKTVTDQMDTNKAFMKDILMLQRIIEKQTLPKKNQKPE